MEEKTRINKYLSEVGYCSRRAADKLLEEGRIKINGKIDRIICFEEDHYRNWNDDEIRFTQTIANYLALIIERNEKSKIEYLLQKRGVLLSSLNSINHELTKCSTFIDILNCNYNSLVLHCIFNLVQSKEK